MSSVVSCLIPSSQPRPPEGFPDPLLEAYLEFLAARCRPNSVLAARFDLRVFFTVVGKPVQGVTAADVLGFITAQRTGARSLPDPLPEPLLATASTAGVSLRTVRRRLSTIAGLYAFLTARGDVPANPVPRGLPTRRGTAPASAGRTAGAGAADVAADPGPGRG